MSQLPMPGLGARIADYRKLNGWSAERLAQQAGEGVTRAILAQLESGRRDSLTLQQFCAIAIALGLPPAALLADVFHPAEEVERPASLGGDGVATMPVGRLLLWAAGGPDDRSELPSARRWHRVIALLSNHWSTFDELLEVVARTLPEARRNSDEWMEIVSGARRAQRENDQALRDAGVELPAAD